MHVCQVTKDLLQSFFCLKIKIVWALLDRTIPRKNVLIHAIPINEVKNYEKLCLEGKQGMCVCVCVCFNPILTIFNENKFMEFRLFVTTFSPLGLTVLISMWALLEIFCSFYIMYLVLLNDFFQN